MNKPTVQDIFRHFYTAYLEKYSPSPEQAKTARNILNCKTGAYGANISVCEDCGAVQIHYNSCRNRCCPMCQAVPKEMWMDARREDVLDAPYFHLVFTVPDILNPVIYSNQKLLYDTLYHAASATIQELTSDPKHLGASVGYICILHTWGSEMNFHPHIHMILLGGGLTPKNEWKDNGTEFFLPIWAISKVFRGKYMDELKNLWNTDQLEFHGTAEKYRNHYELNKNVQYETSDTLNNFIQQHWESIAVFKDDSLDEEATKQLDKVLLDSRYSAPDLSCLSEPLRRLLVEHDGYDFTRDNLLCAIGDSQSAFTERRMLSLSQIKSISAPIYQYIIKNIDRYLAFLKASEYALDFDDGTAASDVDSAIVAVLGDSVQSVFDNHEPEDRGKEVEQVISGIIKKHSHTARILHFESDELKNRLSSGIDDETRKRISISCVNELLRYDAIWFTPMNLQTVLESVGDAEEADACGEWLKLHSSFESTKEDPEFDRGNLAVKLLNLPLDVCNAKKKESLVRSLQLESPLSDEQVSDIKVGDSKVFDLKREPDVYARLLDDTPIIDDSEAAFEMIPDICWEARRAWMLHSAEFITYLSPNLLGANEACRIIADKDTRLEPVLQKIAKDMSVYIQDADFDYLLKAAKAWMNYFGNTVDKDGAELFDELATKDERLHGVKELSELGLKSNLCVRMINRALDEQGIDDANIGVVRDVIQHLDVPYRQLFNDKNRTLNTDDENFVSLITKLNQYAKRSDITSEDIWRNPQEKDGFTKYTVAFSSVEKLNEKIDLLQNQSVINN